MGKNLAVRETNGSAGVHVYPGVADEGGLMEERYTVVDPPVTSEGWFRLWQHARFCATAGYHHCYRLHSSYSRCFLP